MIPSAPRIAIVLHNLVGGGAERLHVHLANDWVVRGYSVKFILLREEGELFPLVAPGITVTSLGSIRMRNAIRPLAARLRVSRPDVILAAMWPLTCASAIALVFEGCRWCCTG